MDHEDFVFRYLTGRGVEIGAYSRPIPGIKPIYVDRYPVFAGVETRAEYYGDVCDLPFYDSSLDYVASSHVLEHAANPLAGLKEWFRVTKHGGIVYTVIPDKRKTFDHPRELTSVDHMLEDYRKGMTMADDTHLDEFTYGVDWKQFSPESDPGNEQRERAEYASKARKKLEAVGEVNIHFHTFQSETGRELFEAGNREHIWPGRLEILEVEEDFPTHGDQLGFLIIARVIKNRGPRIRAAFSRKGLRPDAKKLHS